MNVQISIPKIPKYSIIPYGVEYDDDNYVRRNIPTKIISGSKYKNSTYNFCKRYVENGNIILSVFDPDENKIIARRIRSDGKNILLIESHNYIIGQLRSKNILGVIVEQANEMGCDYISIPINEHMLLDIIN